MEILRAENLGKSYGSGEAAVRALRSASFSVDRGEFVAVVGPSGSGKSSLLNLLGGLDVPSSGRVCVEGRELSAMSEVELSAFRRRKIGFIFQAFNLVPELDVEENIALPLLLDRRRPDPAYLEELLDRLGLAKRRHHLPGELSGGQQQRVAIGRALAARPAIVLADEPTGNLDSASGEEVMRLLKSFVESEGQTLVMITHNSQIASRADRTLSVRDGTLSEMRREAL
jgi:putative ABC transport system ATP-binding protein